MELLLLKTQAYLIIVAIVACALFLLVDLYLLAFYIHKDEPNFSAVSILCKILIILTLIQTELQPLFLIVDVVNSREQQIDLSSFWLVLYFSLLANLAFLKPIATSLYERDPDDPCWKTALWTFFEIIVSLGVFGAFFGIAWSFWGEISMPVDFIEIDAYQYVNSDQIIDTTQSLSIYFTSNLICFVVAFFCLIGYPILTCCGAIGLTVLPIGLILEFFNRPTFRRTADAKKVSQFLKVQTIRLLRESQKLKRSASRVDQIQGFFEKRRAKNKFEQDLQVIQQQIQTHRDYYELFKMELDMPNVNPLFYWFKLIGGIFSIFISVLLWVQILLAQLVFPQQQGNRSIFLDRMLIFLEQQNANFIAIAFIMLIACYMTLSIIKGTVFFSHSVPFLVIHPIVEGKTWSNSFLFHLTLCSLGASSLLHMLTTMFPYYLRGGSISVILKLLLTNMKVLGFLLEKNVFAYAFLICGGLGLIFVIFKMVCLGKDKGELLKRIQAKRLKLFGKQGQNKSLKFIQMTQIKNNTPLLSQNLNIKAKAK